MKIIREILMKEFKRKRIKPTKAEMQRAVKHFVAANPRLIEVHEAHKAREDAQKLGNGV